MAWWNPASWGGQPEQRMVGGADLFGTAWAEVLNMNELGQRIPVTLDAALRVPAFGAAVNVISNAIASLPLDLYKRRAGGEREDGKGLLLTLLHDAPNAEVTSFDWLRGMLADKLTHGRGLSWIERTESGAIVGFWKMDPTKTTIRQDGFRRFYEYRDGPGRPKVYPAADVIDLPFMLASDGVTARGPLWLGRDVLALAIALNEWAAKFFDGGGVPPFMVQGNFKSPDAMKRAGADFTNAVRKAATEKRMALTVPVDVKVERLGANPEQSQTVELQRFVIEQIARIFSLPPTFLQDLSHGTFSNTEQQDLHFVKHTVLAHVRQVEQQMNLKLFGQTRRGQYVEFNIDGLQRGAFSDRMEGWQKAINSGLTTPNEARRAENYPDLPGGDRLFMQSGTVPIDQAGQPSPASNGAGAPGANQE